MVDLGPFTGLDLSPGAANNPGALTEALNVIVNTEGALVRRPALNFRARLPVTTAGLYSVGNQVRCIAYHGTDATGLAPTVYLDYCETDVTGAEVLGQMVGSDFAALVLVKLADTSTELHHCPQVGTDPVQSTKITWSGTPAFALIGMESRGWALDQGLAKLWHSALDASTPAQLSVWGPGGTGVVSSEGFFSVGQHAAGAGRPSALGEFGGRLAIFYEAATQVWRLDTDRTRCFKDKVIPGVGTKAPRSVASVVGDILLLTNAGVRSLTTVTQTLDTAEDPIGSRVDPLANRLGNETGAKPRAVYARHLGCYLLAFGTDVLCLSLVPGKKVNGWSRWELPVAVDDICEANAQVWIRSGRNVFSLDEVDQDDANESGGVADVPVRWGTVPRSYPQGVDVHGFSTTATETHRAQVRVDDRPALDVNGGLMGSPVVLPGRSPTPVKVGQSKEGKTVALHGQDDATAYTWRLDTASLLLTAKRGA